MSDSRAFWAIYFSVGVSYLGVGLVAPLIAIVLAGRGENSLMVGLIGTTTFAAFTISSFPLGAASDRIGPKPVLIWGLVVYGLAILCFAFVRGTWLFFLVRAVEGVGAAAISVATETMINFLSRPRERARRMSYYALAVGLGWASGPITGTLMFGISAAAPFIACFGLSIAAALLALAFVQKTRTDRHTARGLWSAFSIKLLAPISAGAVYGYLMSSLITLFPIYLTRELRVPETAMGTIITVVIVGTICSQVPIGHAADRFGKTRVLFASAVLLAIAFFSMSRQERWTEVMLLSVVIGALAGSLYPIGLSIIGDLVSKQRLGAATSLFSLAFGIGSLVGPSASGVAMTTTGNPRWLFYIPTALALGFAIELMMLKGILAPRREYEAAD
jgi:MFS family permease